jgi:hypothetical protein
MRLIAEQTDFTDYCRKQKRRVQHWNGVSRLKTFRTERWFSGGTMTLIPLEPDQCLWPTFQAPVLLSSLIVPSRRIWRPTFSTVWLGFYCSCSLRFPPSATPGTTKNTKSSILLKPYHVAENKALLWTGKGSGALCSACCWYSLYNCLLLVTLRAAKVSKVAQRTLGGLRGPFGATARLGGFYREASSHSGTAGCSARNASISARRRIPISEFARR